MFADELLIGQFELKVDEKGRIIIPKCTKREEGDKLVLIKDNDFNLYRLYNDKLIDKIFTDFKIKKTKCKSKNQIKEISKEELEFCKTILTAAKLDKQGRFAGLKEFAGKTFTVIGAGDHLILELKK